MSVKGQLLAAIFLGVTFAAYGLAATDIPSFPGQEVEPFKPRTMPVALAAAGLLLCMIRILQLLRTTGAGARIRLTGFDWGPAALLCVAMLGYGLLLNPLGFVIATTIFLAAGFLILGERRPPLLILMPFVFSLAFYLLMTRALGLYLAPGPWRLA